MSFLSFVDATNAIRQTTDSVINTAQNSSKIALPHFIKPALIESPCFIQSNLAEEPVVNDILKNLYNVYIGYILCALQMNDLVVGGRRVRDILETVSTENMNPFVDAVMLTYGLQGTVEDINLSTISPTQIKNANSGVTPDKAMNIPIVSGRQIELKFSTGEKTDPIVLTVNVKFNPRLVPEPVIEYILAQNNTEDIYRRWLQYRSGEIRFFKDFVFEVDKRSRLADALKLDKSNALSDILVHKNKNNFKRLLGLASSKTQSQNMANSILIMDEDTVSRETKKIGFNFDRLTDRKRFFENTFNLFIVMVDNRYSRVTIYTNGIDQSASYSFNEMKASAASDKMSIKEVMDYLSKAQAPRF